MEQYTWLEFVLFTVFILIIYYGFVFFRYYYPYLGDKTNPSLNEDGSINDKTLNAQYVDEIHEQDENPFIKKFDIVDQTRSPKEININNSNISNNFNNFENKGDSSDDTTDQDLDESSPLNALDSVYSNLPIVNEVEDEVVQDVEPDIDLTDILPEVQELDVVDMNVTEFIAEDPENKNEARVEVEDESNIKMDTDSSVPIEEEINAYIDPNVGQLNFSFGPETGEIINYRPQHETKIEEQHKNHIDTKEDDSYFDFN